MASDRAARFGRSELARRAGSEPETVRYYERLGLLPAPRRTAAGHRVYGQRDVDRLAFIRRTRALGFPLADVRQLLAVIDGDGRSCGEVRRLTEAQRDAVHAKIADLQAIAAALDDLAARCAAADPDSPCPAVDRLLDPASERPGSGDDASRDGVLDGRP